MRKYRTDLATEVRDIYKESKNEEVPGVRVDEETGRDYSITRVEILDEIGEEHLGKARGTYVTIDVPNMDKSDQDLIDEISIVLSKELQDICQLTDRSKTLIIGLGNRNITSDSLGPRVVERVLVTRQFFLAYNKEIDVSVTNVAAMSPGVMGLTGIETSEIVKGIVEKVKPDLVIAIDALASRKMSRVSSTIQIADSGINPGGGIGNKRLALNEAYLGIPVVAVGVPTVVDAATMINDTMDLILDSLTNEVDKGGEFYKLLIDLSHSEKYTLIEELLTPSFSNTIVTPKDIDLLIDNISIIIANGLNIALHPGIDASDVNRYIK